MKRHLLAALTCIFIVNYAIAQNVGIGTTTPTDQLHTTGSVRFQGVAAMGKGILQIDDSGKVFTKIPAFSQQNTTPQSIPDNGCATGTGITSTITLTGLPSSISSARIGVMLNITHTFATDLTMILTAPNGQSVMLTKSSFLGGANMTNTYFNDNGIGSLGSTGAAPFTDTFKPAGFLTTCDPSFTLVNSFGGLGSGNINPNGNWYLTIFDEEAADVGTLQNWKLIINATDLVNVNKMAVAQQLTVNGNLTIPGGPSPKNGRLLTSDSFGNAKWEPAKVGFGAVPENTTAVTSAATIQTLPFSSTASATGTYNNYTGFSVNCEPITSTYGFIAPSAGMYHFDVRVGMNYGVASASGTVTLYLQINGSPHELNFLRIASGSGLPGSIDGSFNIMLAEDATVKVLFSHNVGITITAAVDRSIFSGFKVQ